MARQPGFFDMADRYEALSKLGDLLEQWAQVIDYEPFRYRLNKSPKRLDGLKGGRPPCDVVAMAKIPPPQAHDGLSGQRAEFLMHARSSFMRFLGFGPGDAMPEATTIWLFREHPTRAKALDKLFDRFNGLLEDKGYPAMGGRIRDAGPIPAPRQHLDDAEKQAVKDGKTATAIRPDAPREARRKDGDARWTLIVSKAEIADTPALAIPLFCYQSDIGIDRAHGSTRTVDVTSAPAGEGRLSRRGLVSGNITTLRPTFGPTAPIVQQQPRNGSTNTASTAGIIAQNRAAKRCPNTSPKATPPDPKSAPPLNTSLRNGNPGSGCMKRPIRLERQNHTPIAPT